MSSIPISIGDIHRGEWQEHPRFHGVFLKTLLTASDNPFANANTVKVPPGGEIGTHLHETQVETIYVISGQAIFTLEQQEFPLITGQIIAVPGKANHSLRNESSEMVELLTVFTPPL